MTFNITKCCCIHFSSSQTRYFSNTYLLYSVPLPSSDYCKYLGITLQSYLKWDRHIQEKIANANSILGLLQRNIKVSSIHIKELAYKALVRPKLEYACTVWLPWQQYLIDNIEKVQRRAARYVCNVYDPFHSVTTLLQNLSWESLETRRTKISLHMFYKMFHNLVKIPYQQYTLPSTTSIRGHHHYKLIQLSCRKNPFKYSFITRTIPTWNKLPNDLINCNTLENFKHKLDIYFTIVNNWTDCTWLTSYICV